MTDEKRLAEIEARACVIANSLSCHLDYSVGSQAWVKVRDTVTAALRAAHAAGLQEAAEIVSGFRPTLSGIAAAILAQKDKAQ